MASILYQRDGAIATITLNRPEKRNALSLALMGELLDQLHETGRDATVDVVILAAAGAVFSSGHDLSEMVGHSEDEYKALFDLCSHLMTSIQELRQPVIAQVQGPATAAGCQLVATCDLAIAADTAWFATPGVKIGLFCTTPMVALTRAIGRKRAMQMLLTGSAVDAMTAAQWGLINEAVPGLELTKRTHQLARTIASFSSVTVGIGKKAFYEQIDMPQTQAYAFASKTMTSNTLEPDAQEGITAFLEKRKPIWKGRDQ